MKYNVNFTNLFRHYDEIDEITIKYTNEDLNTILEFIEKYKNKKINFDIVDNVYDIADYIDVFSTLIEKDFNIAVKCLPYADTYIALKQKDIPFYFATRVDRWDTLNSFISCGVSEVYIVNELAFQMNKVKDLCQEHSISIRVFANISQTSAKLNNIDRLTGFYIRPEDVKFYENYVDCIEFFGPLEKQSVLFEIYQNETWSGSLSTLILGLDERVFNAALPDTFALRRIKCGKMCSYNKCTMCRDIKNYVNTLAKKEFEKAREEKIYDDNSSDSGNV